MRTRTSPDLAHGMVSHLSLHAADSDELVEDQQGSMDPIIAIHALLLGQSLIKPFLCFFECVLCRYTECLNSPMPEVIKNTGPPQGHGWAKGRFQGISVHLLSNMCSIIKDLSSSFL